MAPSRWKLVRPAVRGNPDPKPALSSPPPLAGCRRSRRDEATTYVVAMRSAQRTAQRPGLMGFSPGLWLRFVARRFGIENLHRRDAGNEYNHRLSRMVKLRRRQAAYARRSALARGAPQNDK